MATETKSVDWEENKVMDKFAYLKVATVTWECSHSQEGCVFSYSYAVVFKKRKCPRNMGHLNTQAGKWFWGGVAAVAAIVAIIATGGAVLGISAAAWAAIAAVTGGVAALSGIVNEFQEKYRDCKPAPAPDPETKSDSITGAGPDCNLFCAKELSTLWAKLLEKNAF
ncbi:MAG: hypothetical protein ACFHVJ_11640 [Aestuariibacter sp.]